MMKSIIAFCIIAVVCTSQVFALRTNSHAIENLAIAGGQIGIWATGGALEELETCESFDLKRLACTSDGCLVGALKIGGYTGSFILNLMRSLPFGPRDTSAATVSSNVLNRNGVFDVTGTRFIVNRFLASTTGIGNNVTGIVGPTFQDLYNFNPVEFTVGVYNMNLRRMEYFNHHLTPDISVGDAVAATSGYPLHLVSFPINGYQYTTGGFKDNYPIERFANDVRHTIGIDFDWAYPTDVWNYENQGADNVIGTSNLFMHLINPNEETPVRMRRRTALVEMPTKLPGDASEIIPYAHYLTPEQKERIVEAGSDAMHARLSELRYI